MPLDESAPSAPAAIDWPAVDRRLFGEGRPAPPPFPLHLLPDKWRAWAEACTQPYVPADYVVQSLLAAVSGVCGTGIEVRVTPQWYEPLVTWRALVGGPSSGKSPGLASARWLIETMQPGDKEDPSLAPVIFTDATMDALLWRTKSVPRGAMLWREDLAGWMTASDEKRRAAALAGWSGGDAALLTEVSRFPLGIVGTLALDRLDVALGGGDDGPAARFLYVWPEPGSGAALNRAVADHAGVCALLLRLARHAGTVETPTTLRFDDSGLAKLDELMPVFPKLMQDADGLEAAWIGKGRGTVVRLAALQRLMQWAADDTADVPKRVGAEQVEQAFALWFEYYLPHARAVFDHAGVTETDRLTRRAARWLRRHWREQISLLNIRRDALAHRVDAEGAEEVMAALETAGMVRALPVPEGGGRGRKPLRWAVNPALR